MGSSWSLRTSKPSPCWRASRAAASLSWCPRSAPANFRRQTVGPFASTTRFSPCPDIPASCVRVRRDVIAWSATYFKERFGDLEVPVRDYRPKAGPAPYFKRQMPFRQFLDYWEGLPEEGPAEGENLYLAEWNFSQQCPGLLEDFETPPHFQE